MIQVKDKYKSLPVHKELNGKRVAIGGDITLHQTPPALPKIIKECTESEYQELYDSGAIFFFDLVENKAKQSKQKKNKEVVSEHDETDPNADTILPDTEHSIE